MKGLLGRRRHRGRDAGFLLRVCLLAFVGLGAFDELHVDRHFDLQHVDAVLVLGELGHGRLHDLGLFLCVLQALFIGAFFVSNELEEEGNIVGAAFVAKALHPGMLDVIDLLRIKRRVVQQDLDTVRSGFLQALSDQWSSRSPRRPGPVLSYPVFS